MRQFTSEQQTPVKNRTTVVVAPANVLASRMLGRRWIVLPLVLLAALVFVSPALGYAAFRTPGEAAYCGISEGEGPLGLICWTPNDGFTVSMTLKGTVSKRYVNINRGMVQNLAPVLRFGRSWRVAGFVCISRSSGLTCTNQRGHGWHLGRYIGYEIY
jgi:hypothetical protein